MASKKYSCGTPKMLTKMMDGGSLYPDDIAMMGKGGMYSKKKKISKYKIGGWTHSSKKS